MNVRTELRTLADPTRAEQEKRYLKSDLTHLGVTLPAIRKIAVRAARDLSREQTLHLADDLWSEPVHEFRMAAIEVLIRNARLLTADDLPVAEQMIRRSHTWAYVDALAIKLVGDLVVRFPPLATDLDRYAHDDDFWIRRTALLALIPAIRTGNGDLTRLTTYTDLLIDEKEFFIRKALGWTLRELSKVDPPWVTTWTETNLPRVSGVTFREAVRHLPTREELLAAYRAR